MYSQVEHPQGKPPPFRRDMVPLPIIRLDINMANEARILVSEVSDIDYIVDEQFSEIYY